MTASENRLPDYADLIARVFDAIPDEIVVLDEEMTIQEANASFLRNNELKLEEIRGKYCYDVDQRVRGNCRVQVDQCPFHRVMEEGRSNFHARSHFDAEGNLRYAAIVGAPLFNDEGRVVGVIEMTRDITERVLLKQELAATEVRLQQFLELAPLATYVKNRQRQYLEVNPSACHLLGRPKTEILGRTDREILPPAVAEAWGRGDREVLRGGEQCTTDVELVLGDRPVYLSAVKYPVLDTQGRVTAVCALFKDVTAQREAEAELGRTREYLQNILDHSPMIITTTDLAQRIVSFNPGAEHTLGYAADDVIGQPFGMLFADPAEGADLLHEIESEGRPSERETSLKRRDGTELPVAISLSALRNSHGAVIGTVGMSKDISHRKALMQQIMRSERQAALGRLASGVAHEINNPLAVIYEITGYLQDLLEGGVGASDAGLRAELAEGLPKIVEHVKRGRRITSRLLSFAGKSLVVGEITGVNAALDEILGFLGREAALARVEIHRDFQHDLPAVAVEEMQLQEVFICLIDNALKALRERGYGNIWLTTRKAEGSVSVTVRDDGPGIPEEVRDRLFEPFVSTKAPGEGTGLGLSISHGIVKRYDGEIRVSSATGGGATFEVILPAAPSAPSTESTAGA